MKAAILLLQLFASQLVLASPIQWTTTTGGNGHYYELVTQSPLSWDSARTAAENRGGYLATPTSAAENNFIVDVVGGGLPGIFPNLYWLGGFQPADEAVPDARWQWITGESWAYTNWAVAFGEPNDFFGPASEQYLTYDEGQGKWNDVPRDWGFVQGYVVEFDALPIPEPNALGLVVLSLLAMSYFIRAAPLGRGQSVRASG
jgi:hypothetical protein